MPVQAPKWCRNDLAEISTGISKPRLLPSHLGGDRPLCRILKHLSSKSGLAREGTLLVRASFKLTIETYFPTAMEADPTTILTREIV